MKFSSTFHRILSSEEKSKPSFLWEVAAPFPFNEAIVSWNGMRPSEGAWTIYVSLFQEKWSSWMKYAEWGCSGQKTFTNVAEFAQTFQDIISADGSCIAVRIRIEGENVDSLHVCLSDLSAHAVHSAQALPNVELKGIKGQSQRVLNHPRRNSFCSPTSTSTALSYLLKRETVDPVFFAKRVRDDSFDIYGNWILNAAEAYHQLGGSYRVHIERLNSFNDLHAQLMKQIPVVVSVKGKIPGAPQTYPEGHLLCIVGYDTGNVLCIDPAFERDEETHVRYKLEDFLIAWGARKNLSYVFVRMIE